MSFVIEARMDAIKQMSNEKRVQYEDHIEYIKEKIERCGYNFTAEQRADWCHILKFRQMQLALDDLATLVRVGTGTLDTKKMMDDALEAVRLYHASCSMRHREKQIVAPKRPDSPYLLTEIFTPCESCQPVYDTGGAMLATRMRPDDKHVGPPMIVHAEGALPPAATLTTDDEEDLYA